MSGLRPLVDNANIADGGKLRHAAPLRWNTSFIGNMLPQEHGISRLIPRPGGEHEHCSRRILFTGGKILTVEFEEQYAKDEARALVAINKRMVFDDARRIGGRQRRAEGATLKELARSYDVSQATISRLGI